MMMQAVLSTYPQLFLYILASNMLHSASTLGSTWERYKFKFVQVLKAKKKFYAKAWKKFTKCLAERHQDNANANHRLAFDHRRRGQVLAETGHCKAHDEFRKALDIATKTEFWRYVEEIKKDIRRYGLDMPFC